MVLGLLQPAAGMLPQLTQPQAEGAERSKEDTRDPGGTAQIQGSGQQATD